MTFRCRHCEVPQISKHLLKYATPTAQAVQNPCYKFEIPATENAEMEESQFRTLHVIYPTQKKWETNLDTGCGKL